MPTLVIGILNKPAHPQYEKNQQHGFTLLEIIVVLLVIGVISSLVTLSFAPLSGKTLKTEAQKLTQIIEYASQEAVLASTEQKLTINDAGYQFYRLEQDTWMPIEKGLLRPRQFPDIIQLELASDSDSPTFPAKKDESSQENGSDNITSSTNTSNDFTVYFLSSGEISPFDITFSEQDNPKQFILSADNAGNIRLETAQ